MNKKSLLVAIFATLFVLGCGSSIGDLNLYQNAPMEKSPVMPTKAQLKQEKTKVVIYGISNNSIKAADFADLGESLYVNLSKELSAGKTVEILDRSLADKLQNEIKLSEISNMDDMPDDQLKSAQFALEGKISQANFTSRFVEGRYWYDSKGYRHYDPPYYNYTAEVAGVIKIYAIPSMKEVKSIEFSDNSSRKENSKFLQGGAKMDAGLIRAAGRDAIHSIRISLNNFFSPKGYVMEKRKNEDNTIVKITLGRKNGLKTGDSVTFYSTKTTYNQLTEEEEVEDIVVAKGVVSEHISKNYAWVKLTSESKNQPLRFGDFTRKIFERSTADFFNDIGKTANAFAK